MVKRPNLLLWGALIGPSLTWLLYLGSSFTIAAYACERGSEWIMPLMTAVALVVSGLFLVGSRRTYIHFQKTGDQSGIFLSVVSLLLGVLIVLILLSSELSNHLVTPCM
ncbi:MAG: hypothetical protein KC478_01070 [Bacteriovoracaceae bacterium]|nr:hypothetical protein [Bacteriovoracaceae bacterium]